jgi:hypothetical protein
MLGSIGMIRAHRNPQSVNRNSAATSLITGILVLAAQIVLWWILYKAPEWAREI